MIKKMIIIFGIIVLLLIKMWTGRPTYFNDPNKKIEIVAYTITDRVGHGEQYFWIKNFNRDSLSKSLKEIEDFITIFVDTNTIKKGYVDFVFIEYSDRIDQIMNIEYIGKIKFINRNGHRFHDYYLGAFRNADANLISYRFSGWNEDKFEKGIASELAINSTENIPNGYIYCSLSNRRYGIEFSRTDQYIKRDFKLRKNR